MEKKPGYKRETFKHKNIMINLSIGLKSVILIILTNTILKIQILKFKLDLNIWIFSNQIYKYQSLTSETFKKPISSHT